MGLKVLLYLWLLLVVQGALHLNRGLTKRSNGGIHPEKLSATQLAPSSLERSLGKSRLQSVVAISGGKLKMEPKKGTGAWSKINAVLAQVKPVTRFHVTLIFLCTVLHTAGFPSNKWFGLNINRFYELWRPFTSVAFLGPPSMSLANSLYFLLTYGQRLESEYGIAGQIWFMLIEIGLLSVMGLLAGFPFQGQALIAACVYVNCRRAPMSVVPIQFGLTALSWQLPFVMMIIDCLSVQSISGAYPHIMGILAGHFYHFFSVTWPSLGGKRWLLTPQFLVNRFEGKSVNTLKNGRNSGTNKGVLNRKRA